MRYCCVGVDYNDTRLGSIPSAPVFRIVHNWVPTKIPVVGNSSLSNETSTDEDARNITVVECEQDVVCLCLDVSFTMRVNHETSYPHVQFYR